ncbi:MAG: DUF402 domain-containing protein [Syntrophobacteraceae bacterium]|nr:DUF402 domain-containing protein [Syntrophobacteraceae bacterium]
MSSRLKIRSIYATALTKVAMDSGYCIADPSSKIKDRLGLETSNEPHDILIQDREDLQGIEVCGEPERVCQFLTFLQEKLIDPVLLELMPLEEDEASVKARIEFPGTTKEVLDFIRLSITPTLMRHHRFRIVDSRALDQAEIRLTTEPDRKETIEKELFKDVILFPLESSGTVKLEHMRPSGKAMRPREGVLLDMTDQRVVFRRTFSQGRYDGLDLPIGQGDYGLTEICEGSWFVKHSYHTREGKLIGEYFNINTPVELYPYGARYLDLEVDVIRRAGENPFFIDQEKLSLLSSRGSIGNALANKALKVVDSLMQSLQV